jgi:hypothetical protein
MHLEVLVEDHLSGKRMLDHMIPKIIDESHTFRVHAYKGIGRIPKGLKPQSEPAKRILLNQLPRLLEGYGEAFSNYPKGYTAHVAVVCDLDDRNLETFLRQLRKVLEQCGKKPPTEFCFAIEEGEAWLLGDRVAVEAAYPKANRKILNSYVQDSICGTWEILADAVHPGGSAALNQAGWQAVGHEKFKWAHAISPRIDTGRNASPSFTVFTGRLKKLGYGSA